MGICATCVKYILCKICVADNDQRLQMCEAQSLSGLTYIPQISLNTFRKKTPTHIFVIGVIHSRPPQRKLLLSLLNSVISVINAVFPIMPSASRDPLTLPTQSSMPSCILNTLLSCYVLYNHTNNGLLMLKGYS